ncbi:hypothetical protein [Parascardovia denticolens]
MEMHPIRLILRNPETNVLKQNSLQHPIPASNPNIKRMRHHHNTSRPDPTPEETLTEGFLPSLFVNISQAEYWTTRHGTPDQIAETLA